jgi:hypothetical protein
MHKKMKTGAHIFAATIFAVASLISSTALAVGDIARGRSLYAAQCQSCHGGPTSAVPRRAANNTPVLTAAINNVVTMRFLAPILSTQDRDDITTYIGNPNGTTTDTAPQLSYSPTTSLSLSGAGDLGASASGNISVMPAGGSGTSAAATTTFNQCTISGGTSFAIAAVNLSFVGASTSAQLIAPSCTRTNVQQSGTLTCKETRGTAASVDRSWQLTCPAAVVTIVNTPPALSYAPNVGSTIAFTGSNTAVGAIAIASVAVSANSGQGNGAAATSSVSNCRVSGNSAFSVSGSASFVGAGGGTKNLSLSCARAATALSATLSCDESIGSAAASTRNWTLTCPAAVNLTPVPPDLSYLPAPSGTVLLTTAANLPSNQATAFVAIDPVNGAGSGTAASKTISECAITGADAMAFSLANTQEITLRPDGQNGYVDVNCNRADTVVQTSTLSCVERTAGVSPVTRTWTLSCPSKAQIVPQTGWYWNADEGGRGYFIENRNGSIFMGAFLYTPQGPAWWFVGSAPLNGPDFSSTMFTLEGGQSLTGAFKPATLTTSPGTVQLKFSTDSTAVMTWPGGTVNLVRFPFTDLTTVKAPQAGAPEPGWWWNERESGRGFSIGFEDKVIFICGFMYDDGGQPTWYVSTGTMSTPTRYEGQWLLLANGQAMGAPYKPAQTINANAGALTLDFSDRRNGTMTLPDGRTISLTRQPQ